MKGNKVFRVFGVLMIFALLISSVSLPAKAQEVTGSSPEGGQTVEALQAFTDAPTISESPNYDVLPELTDAQIEKMKWAEENTHLSVARDGVVSAQPEVAPEAGTDSVLDSARPRSGEPLAPGSAMTMINAYFGSSLPFGTKSNVMEHSTSAKGYKAFDTGNWFGAYTVDRGLHWAFKNPEADMADFCCDQISLHDDARDMFIWLRMGVPNATGNNRFVLSADFANPFNTGYTNWTFTPSQIGLTNEWYDYPHAQLGADYLWISWNLFNVNEVWTRTVMLKIPLDQILAGGAIGYSYWYQSDHFTFTPISGASHTMYFASNWDLNNIRIYRWDEGSNSIGWYDRPYPALWNFNSIACGNPNWLGRSDDRVLTGTRYFLNGTNVMVRGRAVLAWWWNSGSVPGSGLPNAYIEAAAYYEDTLTLVPGAQGRPLLWSGSYCFAYPSMSSNHRGDVGAVFNYSASGTYQRPRLAFSIADDFTVTPGNWTFYTVRSSTAGASDLKWGDYNTSRNYMMGTTWNGAGHFIYPSTTNCASCSQPVFFGFGRVRDQWNFRNGR